MPMDGMTSATLRTIRDSSVLVARGQTITSLSFSIRSMRSTSLLASFLAIIPVR